MLTAITARDAVLNSSTGITITRENYTEFADRVYPERATYTDIYAIVGAWSTPEKEALLDYLYQERRLPELLEYDTYNESRLGTKDWAGIAVFVVLMRQMHDAELAAIREYVALEKMHPTQERLPGLRW